MLDYAIALAPELHETMRQVRNSEAERRTWLRRFRDLQRAERHERRARPQRHDITAPTAGNVGAVYKMWI